MEKLLYLVPVMGGLALIFAAYLAAKVKRQSVGTDKMKEIADAISEGAQAFLTAEYRILVFFVGAVFVLIGVGTGSWITAICFGFGALFSTLTGYFGMHVATMANVRTANAARESGINKALSIAFSGGAVISIYHCNIFCEGGRKVQPTESIDKRKLRIGNSCNLVSISNELHIVWEL